MLIKTGDFNEESRSDFDMSKKAEYIDEDSPYVASKEDKDKLKAPKKAKH